MAATAATCAVDPASDQLIYGVLRLPVDPPYDRGRILRQYICAGITEALPNDGDATYCGADATKKANFIAPFILDPNDSHRMLAGANSLWVTDDSQAAAPAWRAIKAPSPATDNFINAIVVHEGNGNRVWVGHNNGEVYASSDGLSATPTWTRVGAGILPAAPRAAHHRRSRQPESRHRRVHRLHPRQRLADARRRQQLGLDHSATCPRRRCST